MGFIPFKVEDFVDNLKMNGIDVNITSLYVGTGAFIYIHRPNRSPIEVICTERTNWNFMCGADCDHIDVKYRPGSYITDINRFVKDVIKYIDPDKTNLLSKSALRWLKSVGYCNKNHDERMALIAAAKIAYPN